MTVVSFNNVVDASVAITWRAALRDIWRRHPTAVIGGVLLLLILLMAIFAPLLTSIEPNALRPVRRLRWPNAEHWFGTDSIGRDIYSRVLYGARVSLLVGVSVAVLSTAHRPRHRASVGFYRMVDAIVMRIMDGLMSIPPILLAIALMALTKASIQNVIFAITIAEIPRVSRLVRGIVLEPARATLCRSGARRRHTELAHHGAAHFAEYGRAADRAGDLYLRVGNHHRSHPELPWRRHAAEHPKLGQHHRGRPYVLSGLRLHHPHSGGLPVDHGACGQSCRRRLARCARPAHWRAGCECHDHALSHDMPQPA